MTPGCSVILHFGELDSYIPLESVESFAQKHPDLPVHVYPADHGFNCDQRASYNEEAASLALSRTMALFEECLSGA
jgi:carboxymethylenebutenolidase